MAYSTSWHIGAVTIPATTLLVTQTTQQSVSIAAGTYYLDDPNVANSLVKTVATAIGSDHTELPAYPTTFGSIKRDRKVTLASSLTFSIDDWGTSNTLRDALGYTGTLSTATSHHATNVSNYLWSPAKIGITSARRGSMGHLKVDNAQGRAATRRFVTTRMSNETRVNTVMYRYVDADRVWTTSEAGGEYYTFWDSVVQNGMTWKLYVDATEDTADTTTDVGFGALTQVPSSGAYITPIDGNPFPYEREFEGVEYTAKLTIPCEWSEGQ